MKYLSLFALLFALAVPTEAGPFNWAKHHKRFLLIEGAAVAGASIHAAGLHHCRKTNGVEPCDAHYGLAWASFGITTGMNMIVMPAVAEGCWKDEGGKYCHIFAWTSPATQGAWGIHEWKIRRKDATPK